MVPISGKDTDNHADGGEHDGEAVTAAPVRAGMWVLGPGCLKWTLDVPCYILPCCHRAAGMHLR